ncbi:MAG: DUF2975 domain-containing protein [Enterococcus lacertideformus]|uniref:DUF2975 domain-containing protein n=1 Tax=Enterococcus lacertideformus TaxID=2771493 RepID=A0A931AVX1_9ENTE|nr:DUF2975 domain-containing protein [Enterococcus lacertideformus]
MKIKLFFTQIIGFTFCLIPCILAILLTIQFITSDNQGIYDWQTVLFVLSLYMVLLCGFILSIFLIQLIHQFLSKETFTIKNLRIANRIRHCLFIITILVLGIFPKFYQMADSSDAPGILLFALVLLFIPLFIYILSSVLIGLLKQAIYLKTNYDLTV